MKKHLILFVIALAIILTGCSNISNAIADTFGTLGDTDKAGADKTATFLNLVDDEIIQDANTLQKGDTRTIVLDDQTLTCTVKSITDETGGASSTMFLAAASTRISKTIVLEINDGSTVPKELTILLYDDNSWTIDGALTVIAKDTEGKEAEKEIVFTETSVDTDGNLQSGDISIEGNKLELEAANSLKKFNMFAGSITSAFVNNENIFDITTTYKVRINSVDWETNNIVDYTTYIITELTKLLNMGATQGTISVESEVTMKTKDSASFTLNMTVKDSGYFSFSNNHFSANISMFLSFDGSINGISASGQNIQGKLYYDISQLTDLSSLAIRWTGTIDVDGKEIELNSMPIAAFDYFEKL